MPVFDKRKAGCSGAYQKVRKASFRERKGINVLFAARLDENSTRQADEIHHIVPVARVPKRFWNRSD